jgi:hypothetical protein
MIDIIDMKPLEDSKVLDKTGILHDIALYNSKYTYEEFLNSGLYKSILAYTDNNEKETLKLFSRFIVKVSGRLCQILITEHDTVTLGVILNSSKKNFVTIETNFTELLNYFNDKYSLEATQLNTILGGNYTFMAEITPSKNIFKFVAK